MDLQELYLQIIRDRGLDRISYQEEFLTDSNLFNSTKPVVLAFGTGGGKTYTTIMRLEMFYSIKGNSDKRTLIIPADTRVLRTNFYESMKEFNPSFTYTVACDGDELEDAINSDVQCIIVLPQTLHYNTDKLVHFHNVVLDEAHKWYFARAMRNVIKLIAPKNQLLLTGTPFKYNAYKDQYDFYYLPVADMMKLGKANNTKISVMGTVSNLNSDSYDIKNADIVKKLSITNNVSDIQNVLSQVDISKKTIVYCYNVKQAREFQSQFPNSYLSTSHNDKQSILFDKFKQDDTPILFVVGRGREGFDMPELMNVVDFTFSTLPEVTLQIIGRTLRISKLDSNYQKRYIKIAPRGLEEFYKLYLTGVLSLTERNNYSSFVGRMVNLPLKVYASNNSQSTREFKADNVNIAILDQFEEAGIDMSVNMWDELENSTLVQHQEITMRNIVSIAFGRREYKGWDRTSYDFHTEDSITELMMKYDGIQDMQKQEGSGFQRWWRDSGSKKFSVVARKVNYIKRAQQVFEDAKLVITNDPYIYTVDIKGYQTMHSCDMKHGTDFKQQINEYKQQVKEEQGLSAYNN